MPLETNLYLTQEGQTRLIHGANILTTPEVNGHSRLDIKDTRLVLEYNT